MDERYAGAGYAPLGTPITYLFPIGMTGAMIARHTQTGRRVKAIPRRLLHRDRHFQKHRQRRESR
jgi:hypothetical protein